MSKKLSVKLLTTCDYALTSQDGKLSLMGIFDRIFVKTLPAHHHNLYIVAIIRGQPQSSHQLHINLTSPSGQTLLPDKPINLQLNPQGKANIIYRLNQLHLQEIGEHQLTLKSKSKTLSSTPLFTTKVQLQSKKHQSN